MDHTPLDAQRTHAVGDLRARLDLGPLGDDRHPAAVLDPAVSRQLRVDLGEHLGLELDQPGHEPTHPPGGVVLGEAERRRDQREPRVTRRVVRVLGTLPADHGRVRGELWIEQVGSGDSSGS